MTDPRIAVLSALSSPGWHPVPEAHGMPWDEAEELLAAYDASRAAVGPSAPADRAAILREAAERVTGHAADHFPDEYDDYADQLAAVLRRMADEAQQPETQADDGPPAPLRRSWDDCPGFPEKCPNIRPVDPDPPTHFGGIRCGCADKEPTS